VPISTGVTLPLLSSSPVSVKREIALGPATVFLTLTNSSAFHFADIVAKNFPAGAPSSGASPQVPPALIGRLFGGGYARELERVAAHRV
jgi:hypothetical protein